MRATCPACLLFDFITLISAKDTRYGALIINFLKLPNHLRSKYSQHARTLFICVFFPLGERPNFTPILNNGQNYNLLYLEHALK
jgi:hypothetical protein